MNSFERFKQLYLSFAPCETGRADLARARTVREFLTMPSRDLPWLTFCLLEPEMFRQVLLDAALTKLSEMGIDVDDAK